MNREDEFDYEAWEKLSYKAPDYVEGSHHMDSDDVTWHHHWQRSPCRTQMLILWINISSLRSSMRRSKTLFSSDYSLYVPAITILVIRLMRSIRIRWNISVRHWRAAGKFGASTSNSHVLPSLSLNVSRYNKTTPFLKYFCHS
jgi:hypothetical protein